MRHFCRAPGRLEHEVVEQVERQVAGVVDVTPAPGVAGGVDRQRTLRTHEVVVDVARVEGDAERRGPLRARCVERVGELAGVLGGTVEQAGDRGADQLDVADLLVPTPWMRSRYASPPGPGSSSPGRGTASSCASRRTARRAPPAGVRGRGVGLAVGDFVDPGLCVEVNGASCCPAAGSPLTSPSSDPTGRPHGSAAMRGPRARVASPDRLTLRPGGAVRAGTAPPGPSL